MSSQTIHEIIKALAYGRTPEQIAAAEEIKAEDVKQIAADYASDIAKEKVMLQKAGYLDG